MTTPKQKTNAVLDETVFQDNVSGSANGLEIDLLCVTDDYAIYLDIGAAGSGMIHVETADRTGYSGTWAILTSVNLGGKSNSQVIVQVGGAIRALRTRFASVSGGTVRSTGKGK